MRNIFHDPSLVFYAPLGRLDGASFMSRDAFGHLCTASGALWRPRGMYFDGADDYVDCGNDAGLLYSMMTIETWLNPSILLASNDVLGKWQLGVGGYSLSWGGYDDLLLFIYDSPYYLYAYDVLSVGAWVYVVYTINNSVSGVTVLNVYINGQYVSTGTKSIDVGSTANDLFIGGKGRYGTYFKGFIDEVRVYNRVLSSLEVQRNYLETKDKFL